MVGQVYQVLARLAAVAAAVRAIQAAQQVRALMAVALLICQGTVVAGRRILAAVAAAQFKGLTITKAVTVEAVLLF
jgi:hypothetical protein